MQAVAEKGVLQKHSQEKLIRMLSRIDFLASEEFLSVDNKREMHQLYSDALVWIDQNHSNLKAAQNYQLTEFLDYYCKVR